MVQPGDVVVLVMTYLLLLAADISIATTAYFALPNRLLQLNRGMLMDEGEYGGIAAEFNTRGEDIPRRRTLGELLRKSDELFRRDMRITRPTFDWICERLDPLLQRPLVNGKRGRGKPRTPTDEKVALAIYQLATGMAHRCVSNTFGIPESSCRQAIYEVAEAVVTAFPSEIRYPEQHDEEGWAQIRAAFADPPGHLPNCVGAVDGMHVMITAPPKTKTNPRAYYNRKGFYSYVLQGICDAELRFTDINVGWPGSTSDARIRRATEAYQVIVGDDNHFGILPPDHYILGDKIYASSKRLHTPYKVGQAHGRVARTYNTRHAQARSIIERAFAMLQGRFRYIGDRRFYCNHENPDRRSRLLHPPQHLPPPP